MPSRKPLKLDKTEELIEVRWRRSTVPGIFVAEASHLNFHIIMGTVYFRLMEKENAAEVTSTFVMDWARRNRLRTKMNDAIFRWYDWVKQIQTPGGTKEGKAFMRAYGYKKRKDGTWVVRRSQRKLKE